MLDDLGEIIRQMSKDIGSIETKVDVANATITRLTNQVETIERTVLRRETIHDEVADIKKELSSNFMWCIGYCSTLIGLIIALLKIKAI